MSHQLLARLRARLLLDRLDRHLRESPEIVAHCRGTVALRGVPRWESDRMREPDRVAVTTSGVVLLIDLAPDHERQVTMRHWCRVQSAATRWRFRYRPLSVLRVLGGRRVIAYGLARW